MGNDSAGCASCSSCFIHKPEEEANPKKVVAVLKKYPKKYTIKGKFVTDRLVNEAG